MSVLLAQFGVTTVVATAAGRWWDLLRGVATLAASVLVVLHLRTVSIFLLPLLDVRFADTIDIGLVLIAVGCGLYTAVRTRRTALVTTS